MPTCWHGLIFDNMAQMASNMNVGYVTYKAMKFVLLSVLVLYMINSLSKLRV